MVGENKGKEGKPPRLDLGYKRKSNYEYGRDEIKEGTTQKSRKTCEGNLNSELKVKEERKEKESDI